MSDWNELAVEHYEATPRPDWQIQDSIATVRHYAVSVEIVDTAMDAIEGDIRRLQAEIARYRTELQRLADCEPAHRAAIRRVLEGGAE